MKRFLFLVLALAVAPALLMANGDPVISYSAYIRSCNPVPLKVSEVQVVKENLDIKLMVPYTGVSVSYLLKNSSSKPIHVDYGFPIDFSGAFGQKEGFDGNEYSESLSEVGIEKRAVRDVHFRLDGRELPWKSAEDVIVVDEYIDDESGNIVYVNSCRLWTYTVLDIPAGATVKLEVGYDVLCNWMVGLMTLRRSPLSRYFPSDCDFCYDFTPAQHWGNGRADEISIRVDCSGLPESFFWESSPSVGYGVRSGKVWTYNEKNFDFASAGPLGASFYRYCADPEQTYPSWGDPLVSLALPATDYSVSVSGAQAKYPGSNMIDGSLSTAWVAPGDGVGESIELVFPKPRRVSDIVLYNGYHKSASLWAANSRVKRMKVDITRADGYEESFETDFSDDQEWWHEYNYTLYESGKPRFGAPVLVCVTNLDRMEYGREEGVDENGVLIFNKVPEEDEKISRIRLTVLDVVPGTQYKDLCLSEVSVLDGFVILP